MKRMFKQWWSSIPPISTKRTITTQLNWTHRTQKYHDIWRGKSRSCHSHLHNWISNGNTYINKRWKTCAYSLPFTKITYYHKNEWQHEHGQYNSKVNECS